METLTKEKMYDLYVTQKLTSGAIAERFGKSKWWTINLLRKYEIPRNPKGGGYNKVDLTGQRFGKYLVVGPAEPDKNGNTKWQCKCDCGTTRAIGRATLVRNEALSCGKCTQKYNWKGYGEISGYYFSRLMHGARRRGIGFDITIEQIWDLFLTQGKTCALSGMPLSFASNLYGKNKHHQTASMDRKDSSKGYTLDNIQWIHKDINFMKQDNSDEYFIRICREVARYNDTKSQSA
jgi:hypothetical protein